MLSVVAREAVNVAIVVVAEILAVLSTASADVLPIFQRGFFCDDNSIRYPYKDSTIPYPWIGVYYPVILVILMVPLAFIRESNQTKLISQRTKNRREEVTVDNKRVAVSWYFQVTNFLLGFALTDLFTNVCKAAAGRLRPNFMSVCQSLACDDSTRHQFVMDPICQGENLYRIKDGRRSFPSGHTSMAFYVFVSTAFYLQYTLGKVSQKSLVLPIVQINLLLLATLVGISRVDDHKHHPTDVLAGMAIGLLTAVFFGYFLMNKRQLNGHAKRHSIGGALEFQETPLVKEETDELQANGESVTTQ